MSSVEVNMIKIYADPSGNKDGTNKEYVDLQVDTVLDNGIVKPATIEDTPQIKLPDNSDSVHQVHSVMQFCHPDASNHIIWRFAVSEIVPESGKFDRFQIQYNSASANSSEVWNHVADFPYISN